MVNDIQIFRKYFAMKFKNKIYHISNRSLHFSNGNFFVFNLYVKYKYIFI